MPRIITKEAQLHDSKNKKIRKSKALESIQIPHKEDGAFEEKKVNYFDKNLAIF